MKSPGFALVSILLLACSPLAAPLGADDNPEHDLRVGFYLLHDVCNEETKVDLITWIKTTPPNVTDYVKRVAATAKQSVAIIDRLEQGDSSLKLEKNPLPAFEQKVRSTIRADKQHQLLFGSTNSAFARALLVTQIEASNYILNISKDLAAEDTDADRVRTLQKMSARWLLLRNDAFRLLGDF